MEDARQVGGRQCNKRDEGECERIRWQAMQGDWAASDTTRGGGAEDTLQGDGAVNDIT